MGAFVESNCDMSLDIEPERKKRRIQNNASEHEEEEEEAEEELNHHHHHRNAAYHKRWRTEREQRIYSSKLLQAIRHVRRRITSAKSSGKEIRETADRVLAVSAKGATRWSRAILSSPLSVRLRKRQVKVRVAGCSRLRRKPEDVITTKMNKKMKLPPVEKKLRVLSRLIPGCRKVSSLNLLEEATDYISALEMQVRAMTALTAILAGSSSADDRLSFNVSS